MNTNRTPAGGEEGRKIHAAKSRQLFPERTRPVNAIAQLPNRALQAALNDRERNRDDINSVFKHGSYQGTHLCVPSRLLNQRAFRRWACISWKPNMSKVNPDPTIHPMST